MRRGALIFVAGIAVIAALGGLVASEDPDGLERVAADLGFEGQAEQNFQAPMPDYAVPGAPAALSGGLAGLAGALLVGGLCWGAGRLLAGRG